MITAALKSIRKIDNRRLPNDDGNSGMLERSDTGIWAAMKGANLCGFYRD
jgi:hypothetical protein